ncbi:MAG: hypothetical protein ACTHNW_16065, partial [Mucilaginibacter sp.]
MKKKNPFEPVVFNDEKKLASFIEKADDTINFLNCTIEIQGDIGAYLTTSAMEGVEPLRPDEQGGGAIGWLFPGLFISNVRFTKPVVFGQCYFPGTVYFNHVYFEAGCTFIDTEFGSDVNFQSVHFAALLQFRSVKAKRHVEFSRCHIVSQEIGFRNGLYEDGLSFNRTRVEGELDLADSTISDIFLMTECEIAGKLSLSNTTIDRLQLIGKEKNRLSKFSLANATVKGQVQLNRVEINDTFQSEWAIFNDSVFLDNCRFNNNCYWQHAVFEKLVHIAKCTFLNELNFAYVYFNGNVGIQRTDYRHAKVYFDSANF